MNRAQEAAAARAKQTLVHYISALAQKCGMKVEPTDLVAEVEGIVDDILAATDRRSTLTPHAEAVQQELSRSRNLGNLGELAREPKAGACQHGTPAGTDCEQCKLAPLDARD